ncbi:MAG: hypothetical protein UV36_C0034G0010 [Parcubacteria group bacterium GW2011_GWC2_42_6]|nr:MAG: hypothetical protein UV36_C0034G0010 [Parcubacteria group bacterium GW2011_GWC2_42_6]
MRFKILIASIIVFLVLPFSARADLSILLPWTMNFNDSSWVSDLALDECGGTSTHVTSGCYSEGCMKVAPPTSACTGGGINGGQTGLGWLNYPGTSELHVRFLIKFGLGWPANVMNGGGGLINKFLLSDSPSRVSILGFNCSDTSGRYCAWAVSGSDSAYHFTSPPARGWIEDATFRVSANSHVNEWMAVEYALNTSTGIGKLYLWTQDGSYNGILIDNVPVDRNIAMNAFYMSYYNHYSTANAESYYLMDNLQVSSSYIGPPVGFAGGASDTTPPAAPSGVSIQ